MKPSAALAKLQEFFRSLEGLALGTGGDLSRWVAMVL